MFPLNQNSKLEAFLGSSPASNIQWSVGYIDLPPQTDAATEQQRGNTFRSVSNAASDVTICPYPGQKSTASTITSGQPAWVRNILYVKGYNPNAGAVTATVQINDGSDDIQFAASIPTLGFLLYEDKEGWYVTDSEGNRKTSVGFPATAVATQADEEAGTSTSVVTTPGRQQFHPSAVKGWIKADYAGTINASYNVTSITDGGVGLLTVTWDVDFSIANYSVTAIAQSGNQNFVTINSQAAGSASFITWRSDTAAVVDATSWQIHATGDQ